jgi:diguanylate cyclase (GGDEF)-like protein
MTIRNKVFLIVLVLFATLGVADFFIQRYVIYPSFLDLEHHEAGENLQRIFHAIDRESYHLEKFCRDWATWDDSYDFMTSGSEDFVSSNLNDDALDNISLNLMIFCDNNGTIIWSRGRDFVHKKTISIDLLAAGKIPTDHLLFDVQPSEEGGKGKNGVFNTEKGPLLFATREILRSDGTGPGKGFLILGRFLDETMLKALKDQTRIPFEVVYPFRNADVLCNTSGIKPMRIDKLDYFTQHEGEYVKACAAYRDAAGEALFGVQYLFPREITRKGIASIRYASILVIASGAIVLVMLNVLLQAVVLRPLQNLTRHAARLQGEGDYSLRLNLERSDEVGVLANSFDTMVQTINDRTEELKRANEKLTQLSLRDAMTGIANRRMLDIYLKQEWRRAMRDQTPISFIFADVDFFKNYNDAHGHPQGDQCLIAVAAVMQGQLQRPADLAARYGGEEFAVILPDTDAAGAAHIAEMLRQAVLDLRMEHASATGPFVTISLGLVTMIPPIEDGDGGMPLLFQGADQALYEAKKSGRNRVVVWTQEQSDAFEASPASDLH